MINTNARLDEQLYIVQATSQVALTSTAGDAAFVSMKGYARCCIVIDITNGSTVTGGAITLKQSTDVTNSQSDEKPLAFSRMLANTDVGASQTKVETAVVSDTFTSGTTNTKRLQYILDVKAEDLDVANGYDCLRVDSTGMANATGQVLYLLYGARYSGMSPMVN